MVVTLGFRVLQLAFSCIVLGLSTYLAHTYGSGHAAGQVRYGAFCGAFGLLVSLVGIAAAFIESLQGMIMGVLDAIAAFLILAGGITFAVSTKVGKCSYPYYVLGRQIFRFKLRRVLKSSEYLQILGSRCRMVQADTAFLWFLFACFVVTAVLGLMGGRRSKGRGSFV